MRRGRAAVAVLVLVLVGGATIAGLTRVRLDTSVQSVVPQRSASLAVLETVQQSFGGDPVVVLLTAPKGGALLGPELLPRLLKLEGDLAALPDVSVVYGPGTVLNQVAARAQELLASISGRRDALRDGAMQRALANGASRAQAEASGAAATRDFDRRYGALLAEGLPAGLPTLRNPTFVQTVAFDKRGKPRPPYKFVIPDATSVVVLVRPRESLDNDGVERLVSRTRSTVRAAALPKVEVLVSGGPVLAAGLGETVRSELPKLALLATFVVGLLFLGAGRGRRTARLVPLVCALLATAMTLALFGLLAMPIALGMLALLPVLLGVGSDFPVYLASSATRRTVVVAALASSGSFASLALSPVPFVRGLGVALAVGVLLSLLLGLALARRQPEPDLLESIAPQVPVRRRFAVLAVAIGLAAGGWALLPSLPVEGHPEEVARGVPELIEAQVAERTLNASGEVDVVLTGPDVLSPAALAWQTRALASVVTRHGDELRLIASPSTLLGFLGEQPTGEQISAGAGLLPSYLLGAVVTADRRQALTSYGVRLTDLAKQHDVFEDVRRGLPVPPPGYEVAVTGLPVLAAEGYTALAAEKVWPNVVGLGLAGLVLLVGLPRRSDAGRALLASALAIGWGLLALRATGTPLTPLTAGLGSLTAAVGCEFAAVAAAAHRSGRPDALRGVALAAGTSSLGYAVLAVSGLAVMRSFGIVLALSMGLAYGATVLVLRLFPTGAPTTTSARSAEVPIPAGTT